MNRVSVVAPLYNEKDGVAMLAKTMSQLAARLSPNCELECVLVDDGSKDGTSVEAHKCFVDFPRVVYVKHERNLGPGAALRNGFAASTGETVCTIDSDCTFDPLRIPEMLELMRRSGADIVTASPYHPEGGVENVKPWRLLLSKSASMIYRRLCTCKLYTYTSFMRAYRREVVDTVRFKSNGFPAVTELLLRAAQRGYTVAELPMILKSRVIGVSKMKVAKTIRIHLCLMAQAVWWRITQTKLRRVGLEGYKTSTQSISDFVVEERGGRK